MEQTGDTEATNMNILIGNLPINTRKKKKQQIFGCELFIMLHMKNGIYTLLCFLHRNMPKHRKIVYQIIYKDQRRKTESTKCQIHHGNNIHGDICMLYLLLDAILS